MSLFYLTISRVTMESEEIMSIKTETIIRTVCLIIALINQLLIGLGKQPIPIEDKEIYTLVSTIVTIVIAMRCWWKNNSFTLPAIKADMYMEELRKKGAK